MAHQQVIVFFVLLACLEVGEQVVERLSADPKKTRLGNRLRDEFKICYFGSAFLLLFFLSCKEAFLLNDTTFVLLASLSYIRLFGSKHELNHLSSNTNSLMYIAVRLMDIPCGPLHMGQDDLNETHKLHHMAHNPNNKSKHQYQDPDAYLADAGWLHATANSLLESETSVVRHLLRTNGKDISRSAFWMTYKTAVLLSVWYFSGTEKLYLWLAAARLGNFFSMFVFHKVLHSEPAHSIGLAAWVGLPRAMCGLTRVLLGQDITNHACHHGLHHREPEWPAQYLTGACKNL